MCKLIQEVVICFGQAVVAGRKKGKTLEVGWDLSMGSFLVGSTPKAEPQSKAAASKKRFRVDC